MVILYKLQLLGLQLVLESKQACGMWNFDESYNNTSDKIKEDFVAFNQKVLYGYCKVITNEKPQQITMLGNDNTIQYKQRRIVSVSTRITEIYTMGEWNFRLKISNDDILHCIPFLWLTFKLWWS